MDAMGSEPWKIAFYADIFYQSERSPEYWIPPANLDVQAILLGGDIHYRPELLGQMLGAIRQTQADTTQIIVVPGNGEYVGQELTQARRQYRAAVAAVPNSVFLDDDVLDLPGGRRIIGSALWSHVPDERLDRYGQMIADLGQHGVDDIRLGDDYLTFRDCNELHREAREFIDGQLRQLSQAERDQTIVCTHFWPTLHPWTGPGAQPEPEELHVYGTDLDALIADHGPRMWLCGHVHESHRVMIGATEVASNPRAGDGPGNLNPDFLESYVVEL